MNLDRWALAFTLLPWPEGRKAKVWALLQQGTVPVLEPSARKEMEALDLDLLREGARARGARLLLPSDEGVGRLLEGLPYPVALWVRGTLPPAGPAVAIVGSREATLVGRARARNWARELTEAGVGVLSGLARGIDGAAHQGALEAGATWGIMGSGLDHPYPPEHMKLMDRMAEAGGVITPFPPEARPQKWHFPRRNWLLVAWTQGVVLLEARVKSGSMVTAKLALDLGRELWVCPGAPEEPLSEGPNALLREGAARACRSAGDVLEDLQSLPMGRVSS
jgi:DNA processing protein